MPRKRQPEDPGDNGPVIEEGGPQPEEQEGRQELERFLGGELPRMQDPDPATALPAIGRTQRIRQERPAEFNPVPPSRQEAAQRRREQRSRPKMRADDLGKHLVETVAEYLESNRVRPDFRVTMASFVVAKKLLQRRWNREILGL